MRDNDAKDRLLNTVVDLLLAKTDVTKITNRQIAELAGVNSALINYYYQSRENLLNQAVAACMQHLAGAMFHASDASLPPDLRLRNMIKSIASFMFDYYEISSIGVLSELKKGSIPTGALIVPILRELLGNKSETELKIRALQIVAPLQVIFLNAKAYRDYLGQEIFDQKVRDQLLDEMIDNALAR